MGIQEVRKYFSIIRKWWWVIALLVGGAVGTMLAITILTETQYEATVTVQVSAPPPQEVPLYSQFGRQALQEEIAQTQGTLTEFFQAGDVAWRVLETLPDIPMSGNELQGKISVEIPESSQLMRISVHAADPEMAALLANTAVDLGLERFGQLSAQPTVNTRQFIEQELATARVELNSAATKLAQFQITNKVGQLDRAIDKQYDLIRSLDIEQDLARASGDLAKQEALQEIVLEREVELQDMIGLTAEYNELAEHVERARANFEFLLQSKTQAQIKENQILELTSIQIITAARPPRNPVSAINNKIIVLGAVVSLVAGVLLTFFLEYIEITGASRNNLQHRPEQAEIVPLPDAVR